MKTKGRNNELGASLVEYALLVALILAMAIPSLGGIGTSVSREFTHAAEAMGACGVGPDCGGDFESGF